MTTDPTVQNPERQHVIPRMLLNNFRTRDGPMFAYNKCNSQYFKVSPNNVYVQKDRYTQFSVENDGERYEVEQRLAEIESQAAPIIKRIVGCRKAGLYPPLAEEEGDAVKLFFITMFLRTDHHADEIVPVDEYEQLFRQEFSRQGEIHGLEGDALLGWEDFQRTPDATNLIRNRLIPDLRARVAAGMTPRIADQIDEFMEKSGLLIAMPSKGASGFIIGDCGGVHMPVPDIPGRFYRWLPISREVVIGETADTYNVNYMNLSRKDVNRINLASFESSTMVVARRESDLDYTLRRWEDSRS